MGSQDSVWMASSPSSWQNLLHKELEVLTDEGHVYRGWLYTVDPVSASLVLVRFEGDDVALPEVQVVMGHAVKNVKTLDAPLDNAETTELEIRLRNLFLPTEPKPQDPAVLKKHRRSLKTWLERHHIPVEEEEESLFVAGALVLHPPYRPCDCSSTNEIVLQRVQEFIRGWWESIDTYEGTEKKQL
uniref:gem-associated protein 6 n=1 Tax=Myxine glutinosa TaxID=7769 RepID=UPI00358FE608